jgi:two-component system sensor kinase FixL
MNERPPVLQWTMVVLFAAAVFLVDLLTPTGIEVWVLYLPVILFPVLFRSQRWIVGVAATCSVLVVIGYFLSPQGDNPPWWDVLNRVMGMMALWLSAWRGIILCNRSAQLATALADLQQETVARKQAEQVLKENEERLRLAMQGAGMGTFDVNLQTNKVFWSDTHFRMLGYEPAPSGDASREMWFCRIHPDDRGHVVESQKKARRERSLHCVEYRICRQDSQSPVWIAVFGRFLYADTGDAIRFVGVSFDITQRKQLESDVLRISAREQEAIGQELHDGVGQELTGLGLMTQSLAHRLPESGEEKRIATRLVAGLGQVHRKVRELSRGLIPVHVETRGLAAALDDLATRMTEQAGIPVTAECPDWVDLPDHATATQMFRIAQEAVANALRHGRPRRIRLTLLSEPDGLRMRIKDDGVGIQGLSKETDGLGIRIMRYRAGLTGGVLQIGSAEGGGTVVTFSLLRSKSNG